MLRLETHDPTYHAHALQTPRTLSWKPYVSDLVESHASDPTDHAHAWQTPHSLSWKTYDSYLVEFHANDPT